MDSWTLPVQVRCLKKIINILKVIIRGEPCLN